MPDKQQPRRRVSYIIPAPSEPVPALALPSLGSSQLGLTKPKLISQQAKRDGASTPTQDNQRLDSEEDHPTPVRRSVAPRHRLGVASLALDVSTVLEGGTSPGGILYSGGRDGLVMSWDLGLPFKRRRAATLEDAQRVPRGGRWEVMTGWADEDDEDDNESESRDVGGLGDMATPLQKSRWQQRDRLLDEKSWELDSNARKAGTPSEFRQSCQMHMDWINDMLLCNHNQTVVTASSDGTVKAWNPHSASPTEPSVIGTHSDYVRCLALCKEQNWVASGSFDRRIKIWDLNRSGTSKDPIRILTPPDAHLPKTSIYAVACDKYGTTIASGSPERVVRTWDPRTGNRTGKFVGHTDNVRAILISDDGRYLLTGSADATIKLWSLASQRCLHTFTYHTESVWSLYSSHPSLEVFYSGDRSGIVCKVDVEGCSDVGDGECVVLCQDSADNCRVASEGINKIMALDDDELVWTTSSAASIKRWRAPSRRAARLAAAQGELDGTSLPESPQLKKVRLNSIDTTSRQSLGHDPRGSWAPSIHSISSLNGMLQQNPTGEEGTELFGIPFDNLVRLTSPIDSFSPFLMNRSGRDPEVATLYSAASIKSVPRNNTLRSPARSVFPHPSPMNEAVGALAPQPVSNTARIDFEERELAEEATPWQTEPDLVIEGEHGLVRSVILNDRLHALTVDTAGVVAVWDIARAKCLGYYSPEIVSAVKAAVTTGNGGGGNNDGKEKPDTGPREMLETVRERIEGDAVVAQWCVADTKTGVLTIHVSERCFETEAYADEVGYERGERFTDESKLNFGKWVLGNLFAGFIREEQRLYAIREKDKPTTVDGNEKSARSANSRPSTANRPLAGHPHRKNSSLIVSSPNMIPAIVPNLARVGILTPLILPPNTMSLASSGLELQSNPLGEPLVGHMRKRSVTMDVLPEVGVVAATPSIATMLKDDYFPPPPVARKSSLSYGPPSSTSETAGSTATDKTATTAVGSASPVPSAVTPSFLSDVPQTPNTPGGGLMGRLKGFSSKISRRPTGDASVPSSTPVVQPTEAAREPETPPSPVLSPLQKILIGPYAPPDESEVPEVGMSPHTTILIAEEGLPGYTVVYRGSVGALAYAPESDSEELKMKVEEEVKELEEKMPLWLVEYLLMNKLPAGATAAAVAPGMKISFVLLPWRAPDSDAKGEEVLPDLLNTAQSKLTASRYLRVKKLVVHVHERMEKLLAPPTPATTATTATGKTTTTSSRRSSSRPTTSNGISTDANLTKSATTMVAETNEKNRAHQKESTTAAASSGGPTEGGVSGSVGNPDPGASSSGPQQLTTEAPLPEDLYEVLCNEVLLPLDMSLAAVRQYVWRQGGELIMHYRRKREEK